jgi:phospholipid-translocating ATPase
MRRRNIRLYESIEEIKNMASSELRLAIVIDGSTLAYALADEKLGNAFFRLGILAQSVICCRVSPKQKADVVGIAKS